MANVVTWLCVAAAALAFIGVVERKRQPVRDRKLREKLAAAFPDRPVLALAQGSRSGGEDDPDYDHVMAATEDGIVFCERRQGVAIGSRRWHTRFSEWRSVSPVVASEWNKRTFALWVDGCRLEQGTEEFLAVIRQHVADPSGCLDWVGKAAADGAVRGVLHGAASGSPVYGAPRPGLLACTDNGVLIVQLPSRQRTPDERTVTQIGWDEQPAATVIDGPLPSVKLNWKSGTFELRYCVLGDVDEFMRAIRYGPAGRAILR